MATLVGLSVTFLCFSGLLGSTLGPLGRFLGQSWSLKCSKMFPRCSKMEPKTFQNDAPRAPKMKTGNFGKTLKNHCFFNGFSACQASGNHKRHQKTIENHNDVFEGCKQSPWSDQERPKTEPRAPKRAPRPPQGDPDAVESAPSRCAPDPSPLTLPPL